MDFEMNTEFDVKFTRKDDKAVYSQNLPMPIHLGKDLNVELSLMHTYGIITVLPFSKYANPLFAQRKPNGELRFLVHLRKITWDPQGDHTITNQSALCQMQHDTWQGSHYSANLTAPKLITACRWRTNVRWKCWHSFLLAELLPAKDFNKVSADLCLPFWASCASTWTQLSRQPMCSLRGW